MLNYKVEKRFEAGSWKFTSLKINEVERLTTYYKTEEEVLSIAAIWVDVHLHTYNIWKFYTYYTYKKQNIKVHVYE